MDEHLLMNIKRLHVRGFTLLEILIALALGMLLLLCVLQVYSSIKLLTANIAANAKFQNNLRFAAYFLRHNIGMAGYVGCGRLQDIDLQNNTDFVVTTSNVVRGFNSDAAMLPSELKKYQIKPHTDVIVIQKAGEDISGIEEKIKEGAKSFHAVRNPATKYNKTLLLADCVNADLFTAVNNEGKVVRVSGGKIGHKYALSNTTVSKFSAIAYFISNRAEDAAAAVSPAMTAAAIPPTEDTAVMPPPTTAATNVRYGLYYAMNYGNKTMLLDGISSMAIRYGVDSKGDGEVSAYQTAAQVDEGQLWDKVNSVVITMTAQSTAKMLSMSKDGKDGKDGKEQMWDIYIKLRER